MLKSIYFAHDSNAQDDPKCLFLIDQMGMEGYGIYWALIEKLRNETESRLPLAVVPFFAKRWGTSEAKVDAVIKAYGLFVIEDIYFFSQTLIRRLDAMSERGKLAATARWAPKKPESIQRRLPNI